MRRTRNQAGYTVVELMMALAIFAIGITGIAAMETMAAAGNMHAKNMAVATSLARSWQERLAMDAMQWGGQAARPLNNTFWLTGVTAQNNTWVLPTDAGDLGPRAGALGERVTTQAATVFCTHVRLTYLIDDPGSSLLRSEVRVFWPKGPAAWNAGADYCSNNLATVNAVGAATNSFYFVYKTTAIRETPAF